MSLNQKNQAKQQLNKAGFFFLHYKYLIYFLFVCRNTLLKLIIDRSELDLSNPNCLKAYEMGCESK